MSEGSSPGVLAQGVVRRRRRVRARVLRADLLPERRRADAETFAAGAAWFVPLALRGFSATADRIFVCSDAVVTRVVYTATHAQDFPGVPAAGARVEVTRLHVFRFEGGRFVEHLHVSGTSE